MGKKLALILSLTFQYLLVISQTSIRLTNQDIVNDFIVFDALEEGIAYSPKQIREGKINKIIIKEVGFKFGEIDEQSEKIYYTFNFDKNGYLLNFNDNYEDNKFKYNEAGYVISHYEISKPNYNDTYTYLFENNKILKQIYTWKNESGSHTEIYKYNYDSKGNIIKQIIYEENGELLYYKIFEYNTKGYLIKMRRNGDLEEFLHL